MEKIINFRPLARGLINRDGKHIRENTILRSGEISEASEHDLKTLTDYSIRYIYDFRSAQEVKRAPALSDTLFKTLHVDIAKDASPYSPDLLKIDPEEGISMMAQMYGALAGAAGRYQPAIESILAQEADAFLYHCTAGKDRTGIFSAILMMAMDFDTVAIKEEYLRIDAPQMEAVKAQMLQQLGLPQHTAQLNFMFAVREEYIDAFLDAVMRTRGGTDIYLSTVLGITAETKRFLQERYLV